MGDRKQSAWCHTHAQGGDRGSWRRHVDASLAEALLHARHQLWLPVTSPWLKTEGGGEDVRGQRGGGQGEREREGGRTGK